MRLARFLGIRALALGAATLLLGLMLHGPAQAQDCGPSNAPDEAQRITNLEATVAVKDRCLSS